MPQIGCRPRHGRSTSHCQSAVSAVSGIPEPDDRDTPGLVKECHLLPDIAGVIVSRVSAS